MSVIDSPPQLVSINEAARLLGVSRTSIYRMCEEGRLPFVQLLKRKRMIDRNDLESFIKQNRTSRNQWLRAEQHEHVVDAIREEDL